MKSNMFVAVWGIAAVVRQFFLITRLAGRGVKLNIIPAAVGHCCCGGAVF